MSFSATASPGNLNEDCVGALVDLANAGGVGNEIDTGLGLLWGMATGFFPIVVWEGWGFSPFAETLASHVFACLIGAARTLLDLPRTSEGRGFPKDGTLGVPCMIESRA